MSSAYFRGQLALLQGAPHLAECIVAGVCLGVATIAAVLRQEEVRRSTAPGSGDEGTERDEARDGQGGPVSGPASASESIQKQKDEGEELMLLSEEKLVAKMKGSSLHRVLGLSEDQVRAAVRRTNTQLRRDHAKRQQKRPAGLESTRSDAEGDGADDDDGDDGGADAADMSQPGDGFALVRVVLIVVLLALAAFIADREYGLQLGPMMRHLLPTEAAALGFPPEFDSSAASQRHGQPVQRQSPPISRQTAAASDL